MPVDTEEAKITRLADVDAQITKAIERLNGLKDKIGRLDRDFVEKSTDYSLRISALKGDLQKLQNKHRVYEESMAATRKADAQRAVDLQNGEASLKGRERAFSQKVLDFQEEKRRFKQTKELRA